MKNLLVTRRSLLASIFFTVLTSVGVKLNQKSWDHSFPGEIMDKDYSTIVQSNGRGVIFINALGRSIWTVSQISIEVNPTSGAPAGATGVIRKNGAAVTPIFPPLDVASDYPPVRLDPTVNDEMTVTVEACTPGSAFKVFIIYEIGGE